ncbi:DHA2 family efflux MFS transporter permease subunit [Gordonia otitidis]|uniref:Drug resistance transporter n=1 Tax=Gordonia otitidis (strain DSM 44809 / CCUG 52243 / JCM 12355 / NBRC 100426 / IFM 10032) TaxID=1108044 RepID=H5TLE0_GORO1|nr:DHA2 family efflux MFS transporter permease subunit [Gordonia otitidis]GAB34298.1 putative drug resistance transporter [Gordonia otitidis NBRC 100426]
MAANTTPVVSPSKSADTSPRAAWLALAGCLLGLFMQMLDTTIVNIALPDLTVELGASTSEQLFVLSVYTLAFACTLLTAATLGGRLGRRRLFIVAMVAFTVTSVLCGLARSPLELIICRGAQGMSAALMSAQTLALIAALFPKSRHGMVFGIYGAVAGLAAMLGPVLGGLLVTGDLFGWGWRAIFFVNVPIGVLACVLAARRLPRMRDDSSPRLDLVGVALSTAGLFLLLYPLAVGREQGWPPRLWAMMGAAIILLGLFVVAEHRLLRHGGAPLLRLDLFASRRFSVGLMLSLLFFSVFAGFFFTVSVATQFGLGYSALRTGLLALPFALGAATGSVASPLVVRRLGPSLTLCIGVAVLSAGLAWLAATLAPETASLSVPAVITPLVVGGIGTGFFIAPLQTAILSDTNENTIGSASGCVPTVQQIGASIGLAVVTIFFFGQVAAQSADAVPAARTNLSAALEHTAVDPMFRGAVVDRFADCASAQLTSAHPERPAPGCSTSSSAQQGVAATVARQAAPELKVAGRRVAAQSFVGAFRATLWVLAILGGVIAVLSLALGRRPTD